MIDDIVQITVRDGTSIGARIYRPDGAGPYPALLARVALSLRQQ